MKIYIGDKKKLSVFSLPNKIEDSFLIKYISSTGIEENIIIKAECGKWCLSNSLEMKIINTIEEKIVLENSGCFMVRFADLEDPVTFCYTETPVSHYAFSTIGKTQITIGKNNADIIYKNNNWIQENHVIIKLENGNWNVHIINNATCTYVNNKSVGFQSLYMGDVIFICGLRLIWMESFLLINNPENNISTSLTIQEKNHIIESENNYTPVKDTEKGVVLYTDDQIFFHTPRIKSDIEEKLIKITPPPPKFEDDGPPIILSIGGTAMMGISSTITGIIAIFSLTTGNGNITTAIVELVICISMIAGTILFPYLLDKFQKRRIIKKEDNRQKRYSEYLIKKEKEIKEILETETKILYENNMSIDECKNSIENLSNKIWNREISDNDFLSIRLGTGNRKADLKIELNIEDFSLNDDNLKENAEKIANKKYILENVPITISLLQNRILPFIISNDFSKKQEYINNIILQIITNYSASDLKIVILTNKENKNNWEALKYTMYCHSDDNEIQFFASDENEMIQLSSQLEKIYQERLSDLNEISEEKDKIADDNTQKIYKNYEQYYLLITDDYMMVKKIPIIERIINSTINLGFSLLVIEPTMQNIPSKCSCFININNNSCTISEKNIKEDNCINFNPEFMIDNLNYYYNIIANIPTINTKNINLLPKKIDFLEMYRVGKIEQLNILNRWEKNNPTQSLSAPVGVHPDGKLFELNLHEKSHGPHGLIAGSTGSGKSEFIITFILSMAINYHPNEVQFVLIDYKGGGLSGAFENRETGVKIPHLVGTITNLDINEMNRTLVSINSELKRRQRIFNEARNITSESTIDIYKYQKLYREGKVKEPISHLFLISDEFAELKAQQPDFMDELISTARIGRSLGVHLILATQKPSGVVDDQIWSNSRFKVALKVSTPEDSNELLKRDDAAKIKEVGRFYLQVGYNEYFEIGQSAWTGAKYKPTEKTYKNIDDSIIFINNIGEHIKVINDHEKQDEKIDLGDQLTNIVKTLYELGKKENLITKQLWLPSIPPIIYLKNIIDKYRYNPRLFLIEAIIGEYDDPAKQFQDILTLDLTNKGNVIIYGNAGSGKENLLMTMIYSICLYHSTDEVNFYIMDLGAETLKIFNNYPQIGEVILSEDKEKIKSLFIMLEREINRRKEIFSNYGGSYNDYIQNSEEKIPFIVVVLNGYESFVENFNNYDDYLVQLARESIKYGVVFIITAVTTNAVPTRLKQSLINKIMLQITDEFDYQYTMNVESNFKPAKYFGRGLSDVEDSVFEFQTANICIKNQMNDVIKNTGRQLEKSINKAKKIPIFPKYVSAESMLPYIEDISNIPIGINIDNGEIVKHKFKNSELNQIIGNNILTNEVFLLELIKVLNSVPSIEIKVIDFANSISQIDGIEYFNNDFTSTIKNIRADESMTKKVYIFIGIGYIYDRVLDEGIEELRFLFNSINENSNNYYILIDNTTSYKRILDEEWYKNKIISTNGIWVGKGIDSQNIIKINNLHKYDANEEFIGLSYNIENATYQVIKDISATERNID